LNEELFTDFRSRHTRSGVYNEGERLKGVEPRDEIDTPRLDMKRLFLISNLPNLQVLNHPPNNLSGWQLLLIENLSVPCFPNVPKENQGHI
jgi:hypothetical protein